YRGVVGGAVIVEVGRQAAIDRALATDGKIRAVHIDRQRPGGCTIACDLDQVWTRISCELQADDRVANVDTAVFQIGNSVITAGIAAWSEHILKSVRADRHVGRGYRQPGSRRQHDVFKLNVEIVGDTASDNAVATDGVGSRGAKVKSAFDVAIGDIDETLDAGDVSVSAGAGRIKIRVPTVVTLGGV